MMHLHSLTSSALGLTASTHNQRPAGGRGGAIGKMEIRIDFYFPALAPPPPRPRPALGLN